MRYLYTSRFEVARGALATYDAWFVGKHGPGLLGVGVRGVHGCRSSVAPRAVANLYEIDDLAVFGPDYVALRDHDEQGRLVRPTLTPAELLVAEVVAAEGGDLFPAGGFVVVDVICPTGPTDLDAAVRLLGDELTGAVGGGAARAGIVAVAVAAGPTPEPIPTARLVLACADPDAAFRLSDVLLGEGEAGGAVTVDVLTPRVDVEP
jgi:hypothetical protein